MRKSFFFENDILICTSNQHAYCKVPNNRIRKLISFENSRHITKIFNELRSFFRERELSTTHLLKRESYIERRLHFLLIILYGQAIWTRFPASLEQLLVDLQRPILPFWTSHDQFKGLLEYELCIQKTIAATANGLKSMIFFHLKIH